MFDRSDQAVTSVYFNFQGAAQGRYPNGTTYSPQELISNAVLGEVYEQLIDPDIEYIDFVLGVSVQPGFIGSGQLDSEVTESYITRMSSKLKVIVID